MPLFTTAGTTYGGFAVERDVFRRRLPDDRWYVYAAGLIDPRDANVATAELVYHKDDNTLVSLVSDTATGAGTVKLALGPVDLFAAAIPAGEAIPVVRLRFTKNAGVDGECLVWTIWTRFLASRQ